MKKFILSATFILAFAVYALRQHIESSQSAPVVVSRNSPIQHLQLGIPGLRSGAPTAAAYKDGEYTGNSVDAYYGNVQVEVVIAGGKISDVRFLDYPRDRETSVMISSQSLPILKTEAIQAQNARVDVVSGATQTSEAFARSLQSALVQAHS